MLRQTGTVRVAQVLIKWASMELEEASWVDSEEMAKQFRGFSLGIKVVPKGRAADTPVWVYERKKSSALPCIKVIYLYLSLIMLFDLLSIKLSVFWTGLLHGL